MKTEERKSMHEIIDETVEFYSNNPRSVGPKGCLYNNPDGSQCAFARIVTNPESLAEGKDCNGANFARAAFKPGYGGYGPDFYLGIQILHDGTQFWDEEGGLTETGLKEVIRLKQQFNG